MSKVPSWLGLNYSSILASLQDVDLTSLRRNRISKLRTSLPSYQNAAYITQTRATALKCKAHGFYTIYGISSNSIDDGDYMISNNNWSDYVAAATTEATWAEANGIDEFQIGNEEETHNYKVLEAGQLTSVAATVLFKDGFESNDKSAWSSVTGDGAHIAVNAAAALVGTYGLAITLGDVDLHYVRDDTPANETTYRCRFYVDPNSITNPSADGIFFRAFNSADASVFFLRFAAGGYQINAWGRDDAWAVTQWTTVGMTDAPHYVEVEWVAATAPGANDGIFGFYVDDVEIGRITNQDSDTLNLAYVEMGVVLNFDGAESGTFYLDGFCSNNTGVAIGATDPAPTATCVTTTKHNMVTGNTVVVAYAAQAEYNGAFVITRIDDNTFTFTITGAPASPATGTVTIFGITNADLQTNLRALVTTIEGVYNGYISYATDGNRIYDWFNNTGDLDYIGVNIYGLDADPAVNITDFKYRITKCIRNFGDKFYLTEFNISYSAGSYGTEASYAANLLTRVNFINDTGLQLAYFFHWGRGDFAVVDSSHVRRAAYYSLFSFWS